MATGRKQLDALAIVAAPVVVLVAVVVHPYLSDPTDPGEIARVIGEEPGRWAWGHIALGLGIALFVLAVFALRHHLRDQGENRWSFWAVPFTTVGGGLVTFMIGVEGLGGRAAADANSALAFVEATQDWWWLWLTGLALFSAGVILLAASVANGSLVTGMTRRLVVVALVIGVAGNFIPAGWALYVIGISTLIALSLLARGVLTSRA